jgi:hypothetical protein
MAENREKLALYREIFLENFGGLLYPCAARRLAVEETANAI